jgi:hypothetical protein
MRWSLDTLANDRRYATPALARLLPELSCNRVRKLDRDPFHTSHTIGVTQV